MTSLPLNPTQDENFKQYLYQMQSYERRPATKAFRLETLRTQSHGDISGARPTLSYVVESRVSDNIKQKPHSPQNEDSTSLTKISMEALTAHNERTKQPIQCKLQGKN